MAGKTGELLATAAATQVAPDSQRIQIIPMGRNLGRDGRGPYYLTDKAHADQVIEATRKDLGACDLMIDYDHQVASDLGAGVQAKAAGWIDPATLTVEDDGIWGTVRWTPAAQQALADREYRYLSPFFAHTKAGEIIRIINAALVNIPNLELKAVAARSLETTTGADMDLKKIAGALALGDDADEANILAAIDTNKTALAAATSSLAAAAAALGLAETSNGEEIVTAAKAEKARTAPDLTNYVPVDELTAANARIDELVGAEAEEQVDAAIAARKITPANRDHFIAMAKASPQTFQKAMGNQPAVLADEEETARQRREPRAGDGLSEEDRSLCTQMGWDPTKFAAQRKFEKEAQ